MRLNFLLLFFILSIIPLRSQQVEVSAVVYSVLSGYTQYISLKIGQYLRFEVLFNKTYQKNGSAFYPLKSFL